MNVRTETDLTVLDRIIGILGAPEYIIPALFGLPLFSFAFAALITLVIVLTRGMHQSNIRQSSALDAATARVVEVPASVAKRYLPEYLVLGVGAIVVIVVFFFENMLLGRVVNLVDRAEWWRYATPTATAALVIALAGVLIATRGTQHPEVPVMSTARRGWATFSKRGALIAAAAAALAFVVVTLWAGALSSADNRGRYIYINLMVPNTDQPPVRPWFYGWTFGVPALIALGVLALIVWFVLRSNAVRPYIRPDTVQAEQRARTGIAASVVSLATAVTLLVLGGALRFIGRAGGSGLMGTYDKNGDEVMYQTTWPGAQFADLARWIGPLFEIAAFVLLLLVALRMLRARAVRQSGQNSEQLELADVAPAGATPAEAAR